jgi:hypothetical protein
MESSITGGTLNRNQGGAREARPQSVSGGQSVGRQAHHPAEVGARNAHPAGARLEGSARDYRSGHGGQTSAPGTFGVPNFPGVRKWTAPAQAKAEVPAAQSQAPAAQPSQASKPFSCRPPRSRISGLSYGKYRVIEEGLKAEDARVKTAGTPLPAPATISAPRSKEVLSTPAATLPAAAPATSAVTVKLERDRFKLFERIAARENRPVQAVVAECLNGCAIQVARIEAQNIRLAAAASDARERNGYEDDELAHRSAGAGYVEVCLALD